MGQNEIARIKKIKRIIRTIKKQFIKLKAIIYNRN